MVIAAIVLRWPIAHGIAWLNEQISGHPWCVSEMGSAKPCEILDYDPVTKTFSKAAN